MNHRNLAIRLLIALMLAAIVSVLLVPSISATRYTGQQCDITPKYYCTQVAYDAFWDEGLQTYWYPAWDRLYKGGIDGGAIFWEMWYSNDYQWNGSYWEQIASFGSVGPYYNIPLSGWYTVGNDDWMLGGGLVIMRIRFRECLSGSCYYWDEGEKYHYLQ